MRLLLAPLALAACAQTPAAESAPAADLVACGGNKVQSLMGRSYSEALDKEARLLSGAGAIRWIRPGQPVTMDYRDDRLNIELDERDTMIRITCG